MNRKGHVGMTLLAFAPVAYVLVSEGKLALAVLCWLGVHIIEPLPDSDFSLPFLNHRGGSHSLLAVVVVGGVLGAVGWFLGGNLLDLLLTALLAGGDLFGWILGRLPETSAEMIILLLPNVSLEAIVNRAHQTTGESVTQWTFAAYGAFVGAYGILTHLLGDVITKRGIAPFLPVSRWRLSLSPLRADNPVANSGLFGLGVLAIVVVLAATVPGAVLGATVPADLAPIDVAAGQTTNTTQTGNQSPNQTTASVAFRNQTSNGSTITVENVTLSEGGFVVIHDSEYVENRAPPDSSVIAASEPLDAGTHRNVTIDISNAPPGNYAGLNRSRLNASQPLAATVYRDTNANQRFDYVRSFGENDTAYTNDGRPVSDDAGISVPSAEEERQTASVSFENQTLRNGTLTVERATLPNGGFITAHNASYQRTGDPLTSVVGVSSYLSAGNHTNVTLDVSSETLGRTQAVTVQPVVDTNDNQRYDFVRSQGFQDIAYENRSGPQSRIVTASAVVRVPGSDRATQTRTGTQTPTLAQTTPTTTVARGDVNASDAPLGLSWLQLGVGVLVALVVLPSLIRKLR